MRATNQPLGLMQLDLLGHLQDGSENDVWNPSEDRLRMWGTPSAVNRMMLGLERRGLVAHQAHGKPWPYPNYTVTQAGLAVDTRG